MGEVQLNIIVRIRPGKSLGRAVSQRERRILTCLCMARWLSSNGICQETWLQDVRHYVDFHIKCLSAMFIIFSDSEFACQDATTCNMWTAVYIQADQSSPPFPAFPPRLFSLSFSLPFPLEIRMHVSEAWTEIPKFLGLIYQHSKEVADLYLKNMCEIWKFLSKVHSPFCDIFLLRTIWHI